MSRHYAAIALILLSASASAQLTGSDEPARIDIGSGFSVTLPMGPSWQKTDEPVTYLKQLNERGHSIVLMAITRPSGITPEDVRATRGSVESIVKLMTRFVEHSWKVNAAGMEAQTISRCRRPLHNGPLSSRSGHLSNPASSNRQRHRSCA